MTTTLLVKNTRSPVNRNIKSLAFALET